jgi:putative oxidoreductase
MRNCENKISCSLNEDIGKLILRVSITGLMLFHGFFKLFNGIDGIKGLVTQAGLPEFLAYGVYFGEIVFPILIIIGLYTRISSIFFALTMVFAIFLAHSNEIFVLGKTGGPVIELALIYLLTSISIMFIGAGKYSLDAKCSQK